MAAMKTMGARVCGWAAAIALGGCFTLPAHAQKKALPFEELLYTGRALPFYEPASGGGFQAQIEQAVRRSNLAERMAQLAHGIRWRTNLSVGFASCGSPNANYQPASSRLTICYELIEQMAVFCARGHRLRHEARSQSVFATDRRRRLGDLPARVGARDDRHQQNPDHGSRGGRRRPVRAVLLGEVPRAARRARGGAGGVVLPQP
ncbi:hypothetical protein FN976_11090 [Caenimonas sedimenti]|uniref:Uncharacterized protein n=1 Tax=Caenimonas sedimenti TaxID=2596921 RepID=A0A562ZSE8_9BURK|nr:hypothetical protein FN976_11090 [Caenimonas sedimenti]